MRKTARLLCLAAVPILVGTACGADSSPGDSVAGSNDNYPREVVDFLGRTITLDNYPERVAVLSEYNEMGALLSLGVAPVWFGEGEPVSWVRSELEALNAKPQTGPGFDGFSVESLAAVDADVILSDPGFYDAYKEPLDKLGTVVVVPGSFPPAWRGNLELVAEVLGQEEKAQEIVASSEKRVVDAIADQGLGASTFAVLGGFYAGNWNICNQRNYSPVEFLVSAGMTMSPEIEALDVSEGSYCSAVSAELLPGILATTDVILSYEEGRLSQEPVLQGVPAIRDGRFYEMSLDAWLALDAFAPIATDEAVEIFTNAAQAWKAGQPG